ncbi:Hypothetical predicted protein [Olea europaea subsp. europaea]|uniref:Uncharacterized protein n=1 Tax=Olea europaea subsp. europaea TaxID=158383 RepID=A0A8S0QTW4_OLEEU|nr:Hypothetical predicted protein [Olea europaea subsp. europaea]
MEGHQNPFKSQRREPRHRRRHDGNPTFSPPSVTMDAKPNHYEDADEMEADNSNAPGHFCVGDSMGSSKDKQFFFSKFCDTRERVRLCE